MPEAEPPPVARRRERIEDRLADAPGIVLALDFDGTLAPIVDRPDEATIDEAAATHLEDLAARPTVAPAVISGRQLSDLRDRLPVDGFDYAGNHGLELLVDGERTVPERVREWREPIEAACDDLEARLADVSGCEIERKGLTATVHVRNVPAAHRDGVEEVVRDAVGDALEVSAGKAIWEVRPPVEWDKGRAVRRLTETAPEEWLAIYVGDDVTDEDAFRELAAMERPTVSVVVGDRNDSAADYRLSAQEDVADFLALVAEAHGAAGER